MQGALSSMLKRAMAGAWEKYQQTGQEEVCEQGRTAGGGAIRQMLNRQLSMTIEKWQFTAAEMPREQFMVQGVLDLVHRRALSTTLGVIN